MTETMELESQSQALTVRANGIAAITCNEDYESAMELAQVLTGLQKSITEYWEPVKGAAYTAWKGLCAKEKEMLEPLQTARRHVDQVGRVFLEAQEKIRKAAELELAAKLKQEADDRALAEAQALEAAGKPEAAQRVIEQASMAPAPPVAIGRAIPEVRGTSVRVTWKYKITNAAAIKPEYLIPDETAIAAVVRSLKKRAEAVVGGIEVSEEKGFAHKG